MKQIQEWLGHADFGTTAPKLLAARMRRHEVLRVDCFSYTNLVTQKNTDLLRCFVFWWTIGGSNPGPTD